MIEEPNPFTDELLSKPQRWSLGISLVLGIALIGIPLLLILWLLLAASGVLLGAEALEETAGLQPTTFGGGFWLSLAIYAALALAAGYAWTRPRSERRGWLAWFSRPAWLIFVLFGPITFALVALDRSGFDVPDVMTTTGLIGLLIFLCIILPFLLIAAVTRAGRHTWRRSQRSRFLAGLTTGLLAAFTSCGLGAGTCAIADDSAGGRGWRVPAAAEMLQGSVGENGPIEGALEGLSRVAALDGSIPPALIGNPADFVATDTQRAFSRCAEKLVDRYRSSSPYYRAVHKLNRKGTPFDAAEDVAQTTVIKVCIQYSRPGSRARNNLIAYFNKAITNTARSVWRRACYLNTCSLTAMPGGDTQDPAAESPEKLIALREAINRLEEGDREVLLLLARGLSGPEIAELLGISSSAVRQRVKRARDRLASQIAT